jgi:hypothetical protein
MEVPQGDIAITAKQAAYTSRSVIMVNMQAPVSRGEAVPWWPLADSAYSLLRHEHLVVVFQRDAVATLQVAVAFPVRVSRPAPSAPLALPRLDFLAMCFVVALVVKPP